MSRDTPKLVNQGLNALSQIVENDNYSLVIDLNLIENLNTNQSLNYIKLEANLNQISETSQHIRQLKAQFNEYDKMLDDIDAAVGNIEAVVQELDVLTKELKN